MSDTSEPLSPEQVERYARHILLPDVGGVGQKRLLAARVAVDVGADRPDRALALAYLAAAGVGHLVLVGEIEAAVTSAEVDTSILLGREDVGVPRGEAIIARLHAINPEVEVTVGSEAATDCYTLAAADDTRLAQPGPLAEPLRVANALIDGGAAAARLIAAIARGTSD